MSDLKKVNVDLSTIFEPRTSAKIANVGIINQGVDISNTYENVSSGSAPAANTGYLKNGTDIRLLFAELGSTGPSPSVSNITIDTVVGPTSIVNSGIVFNRGGTDGRDIYKRNNATYTLLGLDDASTPVDHTGEWTTDTITDSEWEVACTSISSGSWDTSAAGVGTYVTLDAERAWNLNRVGGKAYVAGSDQCICVFRIREVANTSNFDDFTVTCIAEQTT